MGTGGASNHSGGMTQQRPSHPAFSADTKSWRSALPRRSRHRLLGGVCAGLAESWNMNPTLMRLTTLALCVLPGPMWVVYVAAWALMPEAESLRPAQAYYGRL